MTAKIGIEVALFERHTDSAFITMLNPYEQAREAHIARSKEELARLELSQRASDFVSSLSNVTRPRKPRARRLKGVEPTRKSVRQVKAVHISLSEELLSGGPEPRRLSYTALRGRFETEAMPKRKAADHDFAESFNFTDAKTKAMACQWYALFARQPDLKDQTSTCEQLAFNLGEQLLSFESIRGANQDRMKRFHQVALTDMTLLLGPEMAVEDVLEQLQQGVCVRRFLGFAVESECYAL